jgi:leader peptidase (prepilin peptidase) / N-methyltransferase
MFSANPALLIIIFAFGLCFGSFLNVIVYRLPLKISIINPPSSCPSCKTRLGMLELIPLFGYFLLRGRCRHCGIRISARYPVVEILTGFLFIAVFYRFGLTIQAFFYLTLLYLLIAVTLIDLEHRIVPNTLVAVGLIIGFLFYLPTVLLFFTDLPNQLIINRSLIDALGGLALGGGLMLLIILVSRGGMGAGDMKLMAMIGLYVGLRGVAVVMLAAFIFGALVGIFMMIIGRATRKDALPFAPYLALATLVDVFWGKILWSWYINLLL